jgi:glycerol uptake facilitator-like aquaporin
MSLLRAVSAEAVGTLLLVAVVVGSGIMGESLSGGNTAIALLANTLATGAALFALISAFADVSGAHFNPVVSVVMCVQRQLPRGHLAPYVFAQCVGGLAGVMLAHSMFDVLLLDVSTHVRSSTPELLSEVTATFALLLTILRVSASRPTQTPLAVAAMIVAGYWFTKSTSFANPAVTLARAFTNTFAGIAPASVLPFVAAQCIGAALAVLLCRFLSRET